MVLQILRCQLHGIGVAVVNGQNVDMVCESRGQQRFPEGTGPQSARGLHFERRIHRFGGLRRDPAESEVVVHRIAAEFSRADLVQPFEAGHLSLEGFGKPADDGFQLPLAERERKESGAPPFRIVDRPGRRIIEHQPRTDAVRIQLCDRFLQFMEKGVVPHLRRGLQRAPLHPGAAEPQAEQPGGGDCLRIPGKFLAAERRGGTFCHRLDVRNSGKCRLSGLPAVHCGTEAEGAPFFRRNLRENVQRPRGGGEELLPSGDPAAVDLENLPDQFARFPRFLCQRAGRHDDLDRFRAGEEVARHRGAQVEKALFALEIPEFRADLPGPFFPVVSAKQENQQQTVAEHPRFRRTGGKQFRHPDSELLLHLFPDPAAERGDRERIHHVALALRIDAVRTVDPGADAEDRQLRSAPVVRRIDVVADR